MTKKYILFELLLAILFATYGSFMLTWEAPYNHKGLGKLYLLWQHHTHLEPIREARRVYLGRYKLPSLKPRAEHHNTAGKSTYYYYISRA